MPQPISYEAEHSWFRRITVPLVFSLLVFAGIYWTFDWAMGAIVHSRKIVVVPDVTLKTLDQAVEILAKSKLSLQKEGEIFEKSVPAGSIVRQQPAAGMKVRESRTIRVIISQGGQTLFVPDLLGMPLRQAQTALQNAGLSIGEIEKKPSVKFEKDSVVTTDPPPGAAISRSTLVQIVVSQGPPGSGVLLVPDFTGRNIKEAKVWTAAHQLSLTIREDSDIGKSQGEVLMQSPVGDTPVRAGDALTVVVNSATESDGSTRVRYQLPAGGASKDVRVLLIDESGEKEVFRQAQNPGSEINVPVQSKGHGKARIFVNGIMVKEIEVQ